MTGGELLLINPRRRHKRRRAMTAKQAQYFGGGHKRRRRHRKSVALLSNPRRHHRRRSMMRLRRNPSLSGIGNGFMGQLKPALFGAGSGIAIDYIMANYATSLPTSLTTGNMAYLTRLGLAVGLGYLTGMVGGKSAGSAVAAGGITITLYGFVKNYLTTNASVNLGRYVGMKGIGRYVGPNRVGARGIGGIKGLGYSGPGRNVGTGQSNVRNLRVTA